MYKHNTHVTYIKALEHNFNHLSFFSCIIILNLIIILACPNHIDLINLNLEP